MESFYTFADGNGEDAEERNGDEYETDMKEFRKAFEKIYANLDDDNSGAITKKEMLYFLKELMGV